jgi:hypothetical protein
VKEAVTYLSLSHTHTQTHTHTHAHTHTHTERAAVIQTVIRGDTAVKAGKKHPANLLALPTYRVERGFDNKKIKIKQEFTPSHMPLSNPSLSSFNLTRGQHQFRDT